MLRSADGLLRALRTLGLVATITALAACGGGGGSSSGSSTSSSSSGSSSSSSSSTASNQAAMTVAAVVNSNLINIPTVSVTVCAPGSTTNCQTIPNVQVDTGSFGLRLASNVLSSTLLSGLTKETTSGSNLAECVQFADATFIWGSVRQADVTIGGETASNIPVHIFGDMPSTSSNCASSTSLANTASDLGVNGILGVGVAGFDCTSACGTTSSGYFACSGSNCTATAITTSLAVVNPVFRFASDNNGVILAMPSIPSSGQATATGTLTFGINTQSNNTLTATNNFATDSVGDLNGTYNGSSIYAFFDSGSNGNFFHDATLTSPTCTRSQGFYCPATTQTRTVKVGNFSGSPTTAITMTIASADSEVQSSVYAYNNLAGDFTATRGGRSLVDLGMPFHYGRSVFYGFDRTIVGDKQSAYVAY